MVEDAETVTCAGREVAYSFAAATIFSGGIPVIRAVSSGVKVLTYRR